MYSPRIKDEQLRKLYQLKQVSNKPITQMVQEAIEEYLIKYDKNNSEVKK